MFYHLHEAFNIEKTADFDSPRHDEPLEYSYILVPIIVMEVDIPDCLTLLPGPTHEVLKANLDADHLSTFVLSSTIEGSVGKVQCVCGGKPINATFNVDCGYFFTNGFTKHLATKRCIDARQAITDMATEVINQN